jgi:hypothetical protein
MQEARWMKRLRSYHSSTTFLSLLGDFKFAFKFLFFVPRNFSFRASGPEAEAHSDEENKTFLFSRRTREKSEREQEMRFFRNEKLFKALREVRLVNFLCVFAVNKRNST